MLIGIWQNHNVKFIGWHEMEVLIQCLSAAMQNYSSMVAPSKPKDRLYYALAAALFLHLSSATAALPIF